MAGADGAGKTMVGDEIKMVSKRHRRKMQIKWQLVDLKGL